MRINTLTCIFLALIVTVIGGCASNKERKKGVTEREVYELAQRHMNARNWTSAVETLHLLEENFPFGNYGEQGQLELIYAQYQAGQYEAVISVADRFIRLHPQHRNVDYAYYMRGLASFSRESSFLGSLLGSDHTTRDPGAARDSFDQFSQFIQRFPESAYAPDAQKRMTYLRNVLARAEIHAANYYFKRGAWLAAASRGNYVVRNFPNTPAIPDALAVMAQAYYLMGKDDLAENSVKVLALNFPNYPALDENGEFDQRYIQRVGRRSWLSYLTLGLFDRNEVRSFDTREIYSPEYTDTARAPESLTVQRAL